MTRNPHDYRPTFAQQNQRAAELLRRIPSAKEMEDSLRTHYFRDDEDSRIVVCTQLMPNGDYGAWLEEDPERGTVFDDTRMGAIAELYNAMQEYI